MAILVVSQRSLVADQAPFILCVASTDNIVSGRNPFASLANRAQSEQRRAISL